ncbi:MAG TPA: type II toxin-antitoxin system HicA family toxin [candidate division Zixibacteria bacterium]|nr:type II toxin-antitoxin system HicA family toxin [candidate division Zixibacteria bacterium]
MKRRRLIQILNEAVCVLIRNGAWHDWYQNPRTKISQPVPRYSEIKDYLAQHILKMLQD